MGSSCQNGKLYIQEPWLGPMAFSKAHWNISGGERLAILTGQLPDLSMPWSQNNKDQAKLVWIDTNVTSFSPASNGIAVPTQGSAWGYVGHTGDLAGPVAERRHRAHLTAASERQILLAPHTTIERGDRGVGDIGRQ